MSEVTEGSPANEGSERSYEDAVDRLDRIIARLDSGDAELRETLELCSEAKELIGYCAAELAAVDEGLKELRLDELAGSLAGAAQAVPDSTDAGSPGGELTPEPHPGVSATDDGVPF